MLVTLIKFPQSQDCMGCSYAMLVQPREADEDMCSAYICLSAQESYKDCNDHYYGDKDE